MGNGQSASGNGFFVETTFVLFFLSLDFGQNLFHTGFDTLFLGATIAVIAVFPYFLPSAANTGALSWITGRSAIVFLGMLLGLGLFQTAGTLLPAGILFLPLAMAIISGAISCYLMFSNFFRMDYAD